MIPIFADRARALLLGLSLLGLLSLIYPPALEAQSGRQLFEQAYALENRAPERAAELYRAALQAGLSGELASAARWRLFHLLRSSGDFKGAWQAAAALGSPTRIAQARQRLVQESAQRYAVAPAAMEALGASFHTTNPEEQAAQLSRAFALGAGSALFQGEVLRQMFAGGQKERARELLRQSGAGLHPLVHADLLLSVEELDEAQAIVGSFVRGPASPPAEKARALYLLGRIARQQEDYADAVRYFRLAAGYASGPFALRLNALAAYSLYQGGEGRAALALLSGRDLVGDPDARLLQLTVRADVLGDTRALSELRSLREEIERDLRQTPDHWLKRRARQLIRRGGEG